MRKLFYSTTAAMLTVASFLAINLAPVSAQNALEICDGVGRTGGSCNTGEAAVNNVIKAVVDTLSVVVGIVAVIMIVIGGFKYITSSGDSSNIQSAKNTILYAIVGLVIVALAQAIVAFVLGRAVA